MKDWAKAVSTVSIWLAVGFALGFGLFRMKFSGTSEITFILPIILTLIVVFGATLSTRFVWKAPPVSNKTDDN